ncbi:MAG: hypothetical protein KTR30_35050 [Saprospiraceae bacterium]|nr:hypothetical protein [Saprospiraceae bacterium]
MNNSRLLELFLCLSKKEIRDLRKFVNSPFHNQRQDVIELFEYLTRHAHSAKAEQLDKRLVFAFIYPKQAYEEKKMRYAMSFLYRAIQAFLSLQSYKADPLLSQKAMLQAMRQKGRKRLFETSLKAAEEELSAQRFQHPDYHLQAFLVQEEQYLFKASEQRGTHLGLEEASRQLDLFYIANKFKHAALAMAHQQVGQSDLNLDFLSPILEEVDQQEHYLKVPSVAVYYHCVKMMLVETALPHFAQLRSLMQVHQDRFPVQELRSLYIFALNFCIRRLNAQEGYFKREAFSIYQEGLDKGVFYDNGILSRFNYKNIVALGLGLEEYEWVAQFIENYKEYLDKEVKESTYHFNLALLHYKTLNYTEAMEHLQGIDTDDVLNNLNARRMLACIYYELEQLEPLYSLLDSFQNYIYRKQQLGYHKKHYLNFIKFMRKLLQKEQYSNLQLEKLKAEIIGTQDIVEKVWLLEKLA